MEGSKVGPFAHWKPGSTSIYIPPDVRKDMNNTAERVMARYVNWQTPHVRLAILQNAQTAEANCLPLAAALISAAAMVSCNCVEQGRC